MTSGRFLLKLIDEYIEQTSSGANPIGEQDTSLESSNSADSCVQIQSDNCQPEDPEAPSLNESQALSSPASSVTLNNDGALENSELEAQMKTTKDDCSEQKEALLNSESDTSEKKKTIGWPSRPPFRNDYDENSKSGKAKDDIIYWGELTWKEQNAWRAKFFREYLTETRIVYHSYEAICLSLSD